MKFNWDKLEKRDNAIVEFAGKNPKWSQTEIAIKFRVHQTHVSRVLKKAREKGNS